MADQTKANLPNLDGPICYTRRVQLRSDQAYGMPRTICCKRWKILTPGITAVMRVNGAKLNLPSLDGVLFDCSAIRRELRETLPMTDEESVLCSIDASFYSVQLLATEYHTYFPVSFLFDLIFTGELCIVFDVKTEDGSDLPDRIDMEEEYALPDAQLLQKLNRGLSLEQILEQRIEDGTSFSL
jgi:hypothetical protein